LQNVLVNLAELRDVFMCRRQIDGLKDTMNASVMAGVEGAVAKRIAGDENREYILQVFSCCHETNFIAGKWVCCAGSQRFAPPLVFVPQAVLNLASLVQDINREPPLHGS